MSSQGLRPGLASDAASRQGLHPGLKSPAASRLSSLLLLKEKLHCAVDRNARCPRSAIDPSVGTENLVFLAKQLLQIVLWVDLKPRLRHVLWRFDKCRLNLTAGLRLLESVKHPPERNLNHNRHNNQATGEVHDVLRIHVRRFVSSAHAAVSTTKFGSRSGSSARFMSCPRNT